MLTQIKGLQTIGALIPRAERSAPSLKLGEATTVRQVLKTEVDPAVRTRVTASDFGDPCRQGNLMQLPRMLALLAATAFVPAAHAGSGFWSSTGPYGGRIASMQINPATPSIIYVSSRGGVFKSIDAGASWTRAQNGLIGSGTFESQLMMDAERPDRLYTVDSSQRLMRSVDGGANWNPTGFSTAVSQVVARAFADVPTMARSGEFYFAGLGFGTAGGVYKTTDDGATFTRLSGPGLPPASRDFLSVAVDPSNPDLVIGGLDVYRIPVGAPAEPVLYRSVDAGATWTAVISSPAPVPGSSSFTGNVRAISFGPGTTAYIVYNGEVWRSQDDGATWGPLATISFDFGALSLVAHPTLSGTIYVGTSRGLYSVTGADGAVPVLSAVSTGVTANAGYTDAATPPRPVQSSVTRVALSPTFPAAGSAIWALTEHAGLFRSLDAGATWSNFDVNQGLLATNVRALVVHPSPGVAPPPSRIYAGLGDASGVSAALWRSNDNGATWPVANNGLRASQVRALTIDPTTTASLASTTLYAAGGAAQSGALVSGPGVPSGNASSTRNGGLYKSIDGGSTWATIDSGLPTQTSGSITFANVGTVRNVILDPRACASGPPPGPTGTPCGAANGPLQKVFAAASGRLSIVPTPSGPPQYVVSHRVVSSVSAGALWSDSSAGLPNVINQLIDPDGPSGPLLPFNHPAENIVSGSVVMNPGNSNLLYLGTSSLQNWLSPDGSMLAPQPVRSIPSGVFKSTDGGVTWSHSSVGLPRYPGSTNTAHDVLSIGVSARNPQLMFAATWINLASAPTGIVSSLYRSTDGGTTWSESRAGIGAGLDIRAITVNSPTDPLLAEAVYVAGAGTAANPGGVYRSTDGGVTWVSVSLNLPADAALTVTTDPRDRRRVLAGTNLGVWELTQISDLDLDGAPDNIENNAPNGGDANGDGTPDSLQGAVGSSIVLDSAAARQPSGFLACEGHFTTEIVNNAQCPQARDVQSIRAEELPADPVTGGNGRNYRVPLTAIRFELPQCRQATVEVTFHRAGSNPVVCPDFSDDQWSFRFYGPQTPGDESTIGWYDFSSRAVRVGPKQWRLTLNAGQFGSYRPLDSANPQNDAVLFLGAPALSGDRVFGNGFEP